MKNSILKFIVLSIITTFAFSSCSDYLDKQPDDQLDLESVFENKKNMERWLAYIYRGLPEYYTYDGPDAIADELIPSVGWEAQGFKAIQYQKGNWTADNPGVIAYWNTYPKYIRSAYLFIKHAHPLEAVPAEEVDFMKAECRFFIAYYNSMMAIAYGSVPIIREASESTSADDLMLKQEPFYNVIDWADQEMLEASKQLPATQTEDKKYGRVTSVGCLAMRARMLLFAASDLVNGNPALANIKNIDGTPIFNSAHDPERWKRAVDACKLVIDEAEAAGYRLHYEYLDNGDIDPFLSYQNAVMKRWNEANRELLFVRTMDSGGWYDKNCIPRGLGINGVGAIGITQSLVDAFFMRNGQRPIIGYNSDGSPKVNPDANYSETGFSTQKETYSTKWQYGSSEGDRNKDENVVVDANTYKMYCDREPRFYISVLHNEQWHIGGKRNTDFYMDGKDGGPSHDAPWSGYLVRKRVDPSANPKEGSGDYKNRHGALCRLAEIYLSYAEALNEYSIEKGTYTANQKEILKYVNLIRERAGIPEYSVSAEEGKITAPSDPVEMRELIRQERRVELNCESGLRFNDLRRWKLAEKVLDGDFYGMNAYIKVSDADYRNKYYTRTVYQTRKFISYWWPIPQDDIDKNWNLVQTPDWTVGNQ